MQRNPDVDKVNHMEPEGWRNRALRWAALLRRLGSEAVGIVYPPVCCGCGRLTGDHHAVCPACWSGLRLIERPYCEILGLPFAFDPGPGSISPKLSPSLLPSTGFARWPSTMVSSAISSTV